MRYDILGTGFDRVTMREAVEKVRNLLNTGHGGYVCTPNPEIVWMARKNQELQQSIACASLVVPDGIGIVWASKCFGIPFPERVAGCDFLSELLAVCPCDVFILGGKPGVAEKAAENLSGRYPEVKIVGFADGYYSDESAIISLVRESHPQLLLVCMGAPKQEIFMYKNQSFLPGCVMAGLGGTVDVLAGTEKRAPVLFRRLRIEWLYRLLRHPSRIFRQSVLPKFTFTVLLQCRKQRKGLCGHNIH